MEMFKNFNVGSAATSGFSCKIELNDGSSFVVTNVAVMEKMAILWPDCERQLEKKGISYPILSFEPEAVKMVFALATEEVSGTNENAASEAVEGMEMSQLCQMLEVALYLDCSSVADKISSLASQKMSELTDRELAEAMNLDEDDLEQKDNVPEWVKGFMEPGPETLESLVDTDCDYYEEPEFYCKYPGSQCFCWSSD